MKRWQKVALVVLIIVSAFFAASFLFAAAYQICTPANDGRTEQCAPYHLGPFVFLWVVGQLDAHNGLVTAIATVFVAGFTWTLWRSNEATIAQAKATGELAEKQFLMEGKQADLAERQHGLARLQFIALNRPIIEIRSVAIASSDKGGHLFLPGFPVKGSLVIRNTGGSNAIIQEAEYRFYFSYDGLPMVPPLQKGATKPLFPNFPETIAAHGSHEAPIESEPLTGDAAHIDIDPRSASRFRVWVLGAIRYSDIAQNERWMGFCREYVPTIGAFSEGRFDPIPNSDYDYQD